MADIRHWQLPKHTPSRDVLGMTFTQIALYRGTVMIGSARGLGNKVKSAGALRPSFKYQNL